ncbi:ABC transporter ATP-binding protein [uncultured Tateyamaria sp.]|uniref:ABC transporter ATP-binding protein n=1 Tax=Tateyamaria sp. 1078 TaxID=3417464 RepID=UPI0026149110|nr:ABC transporter ATP-binding protein [uncultured Tateyamaria sp.]
MSEIVLENLGKTFGDFTALADMNLTIANGEFMALLGPSGCGKSTTMNMIAGMLRPSTGAIRFNGRDIVDVPMAKRGVGFVFQNYAIFTHMSVRENLAYGPRAQGVAAAEITKRVQAFAELLQLETMLDRPAAGLSVNILQRLAIGRSAILEPAIFLLDEPLSNVDAAFRAVMRSELKSLQGQFGQTMVYVTHDQLEAMTMADRIAVMDHGKLLQVGTPLEIYNNPADAFVARFIGAPGMNILEGTLTRHADTVSAEVAGLGSVTLSPAMQGAAALQAAREVQIGFRPEQINAADQGLTMQVTFVERIGARTIVHMEQGASLAKAVLPADVPPPVAGDAWTFAVPDDAIRLFDPVTGRALGGRTH